MQAKTVTCLFIWTALPFASSFTNISSQCNLQRKKQISVKALKCSQLRLYNTGVTVNSRQNSNNIIIQIKECWFCWYAVGSPDVNTKWSSVNTWNSWMVTDYGIQPSAHTLIYWSMKTNARRKFKTFENSSNHKLVNMMWHLTTSPAWTKCLSPWTFLCDKYVFL